MEQSRSKINLWCYKLALIYKDQNDTTNKIKYYKLAAEHGNKLAMASLGSYYRRKKRCS